jgi:hypothetical protein
LNTATPLGDLVGIATDLLVLVTITAEAIRALMVSQINRLKAVPRISQAVGVSLLAPSVFETHRKLFPHSSMASVLRALRYIQLALLVFGVVAIIKANHHP